MLFLPAFLIYTHTLMCSVETQHLLEFANKAIAVMKISTFLGHHFIEYINFMKADIKKK